VGNIQSANSVIINNDKVVIDGKELPPAPSHGNNHTTSIIGDKVYINGYEWKDGKWKRTFMSMFHLLF